VAAQAEQLRKEKDELEMRAEQMQREYEHKALALDKEREEEKLTHNEEKRKQLEQELNDLRQKTAQKLAEFDHLKTSLLRDLQNRCEKVPIAASAIQATARPGYSRVRAREHSLMTRTLVRR
jgi:predicted nuclease with TOPRIM domain